MAARASKLELAYKLALGLYDIILREMDMPIRKMISEIPTIHLEGFR